MNYYRKKKFKFQNYFIIFIIVITFSLSFYLLKNHFSLVTNYLSYPYLYLNNIFTSFTEKKQLMQQINTLKYQVLNQKVIVSKNKELEEEINVLKENLNLKNIYTNYNIINATVISKNKDYFFEEIIIDKGSNDGLKLNMAVVNNKGLIGKVSNVYQKTSSVKLLNETTKISVKVKSDDGYIFGSIINYETDSLVVGEITNYKDINIGEQVLTTGFGLFPSGIIVGNVIKIEDNSNGISKLLYLEKENINDLNYVAVLGNEIND